MPRCAGPGSTNSGPSNCPTRRNGLLALIRDGWLHDTHPPVFNAWATLLASLGITSIPAGRLVSNLLAAGPDDPGGAGVSRGGRPSRPASTPSCCCSPCRCRRRWNRFAIYRSYFWQIASIGTLVLVARHLAATKADLDWRKDARPRRDRRDRDGGVDRAPLCRRAVRRPAGRRDRAVRLAPRPAAMGGPDAGDGRAGDPVHRRQRPAAGAQLGERPRSQLDRSAGARRRWASPSRSPSPPSARTPWRSPGCGESRADRRATTRNAASWR